MKSNSQQIKITAAMERDVSVLLRMIRQEAEYEKLTEGFAATEDRLRATLFAAHPVARAAIAWAGNDAIGFAVFFTTFSTFQAETNLYLEDLFVQEQWRGKGVGRKLLAHVAGLAVESGCRSLNWSVLKWNENAIQFYRSIGGEQLEAWHHFQLAGNALRQLAEVSK